MESFSGQIRSVNFLIFSSIWIQSREGYNTGFCGHTQGRGWGDPKSPSYQNKSCSIYPLLYGDISGTLEGSWTEMWRKGKGHRKQNLRFSLPPLKLSLPQPSPPPTAARLLPLSFCTWRSSGTSTCPWFAHSLSHTLAELDWWQVHTPLFLPAKVSHFAQGWDHLWRESIPSPSRTPRRVNYRKGLKWGSGFSPGKLACSNPQARPRERAGLWESGAASA